MLIGTLIKQLQELKLTHGNLPVITAGATNKSDTISEACAYDKDGDGVCCFKSENFEPIEVYLH